ncbi:cyclic nucleotide gated channel 1 isoform X1 [Carex rostrata]
MDQRDERYVRLEWKSDQSVSSDKDIAPKKENLLTSLINLFKSTIEFFQNFRHYDDPPTKSALRESRPKKKQVLDPQGPFLEKWNRIFIISCVAAVSIDPLFLYIPVIDGDKHCLRLDRSLEIVASILRLFTDIFYILHIIFQFRTAFIAPSSTVVGRGVLVEDTWAIAKRYMSSYFLVDVFAVLPLPQVVILIMLPKLTGSEALSAKNILMIIVILQYIPRLVRIIPLYRQITRSAGIITETAWAGAAFNLLIYMLASHVFGALWYLLAIQREDTCWKLACSNNQNCNSSSLYCGAWKGVQNNSFLGTDCAANGPFDFGIYQAALENVTTDTHFFEKFFYCFWWGLQNLISLGQNMATSTYTWENYFAASVAIAGLVLFALLIGNMQTYLQSTSVRIEEMRMKRRDAEQWMTHRQLPESLRERIRRYEQYKWQETRGVNEQSLLQSLPKDLRREIKRHLCLNLLRRVPMFKNMDDQLLDAMCDRLKPALYTQFSLIIREGDPVNYMLFIMRGKLESITTGGGRTGFLNMSYLNPGDFCGEELLTWALDPHSPSSLPSSTRTVKSCTEVEGFSLMADDLRFVATQFRRLHSKQLQHTFKFYSQQWRTWAACFIQAAWRRYCRKKLEEALNEKERRLKAAIRVGPGSGLGPTSSLSLGAALYASRFAGNMLRLLKRSKTRKARLQESLPARLLQKPAEPDFSLEDS